MTVGRYEIWTHWGHWSDDVQLVFWHTPGPRHLAIFHIKYIFYVLLLWTHFWTLLAFVKCKSNFIPVELLAFFDESGTRPLIFDTWKFRLRFFIWAWITVLHGNFVAVVVLFRNFLQSYRPIQNRQERRSVVIWKLGCFITRIEIGFSGAISVKLLSNGLISNSSQTVFDDEIQVLLVFFT